MLDHHVCVQFMAHVPQWIEDLMLFATSELTDMDCVWTIIKGKWSFFPKITTMGDCLLVL